MLIQGQVGPTSAQSAQAGSTPAVRLGQQGDAIVSELHGRYYETSYRKNMFSVSTTGQTTSAALSTSYVGLALFNPPASTVNLVVNKLGASFLVAFAAASTVGIMVGQTYTPVSTGTPLTTIKSNFVGSGTGQAQAYTTVTLPATPTLQYVLMAGLTGAITTTTFQPGAFDLEGSLILPPGAFCALYTSTASGGSATSASWQWEEVPL